MPAFPRGARFFPKLTVEENLRVGGYQERSDKVTSTRLAEICRFPRLAERRRQLAGTMSGGEQAMVSIGRGLMCAPKLLLIDEPSLGLSPRLVKENFNIIRRISERGITVLLVEQNVHQTLAISHHGFVLSKVAWRQAARQRSLHRARTCAKHTLDKTMQASVALTQDLVRFRTINPPGDERACAERLASLLEGAGFAVDVVPFEMDGHNWSHASGAANKLPLGFTGHLDTVPLGAQRWSVDPFAAEILDGKLYGRGSSDMKAAWPRSAACVALADWRARPAWFCSSPPARKQAARVPRTWLEPGRRFLRSARLSWRSQPATMRWLATRERYGLKRSRPVSPRTAQCPKKASTRFYKAARAITALQDFDFNFAHVLGGPTLNVGTIAGGLNINSVPDRAAIGIDIRTIPGQSHAKIRDQLASYLGDEAELSTLLDAETWIGEVFPHYARCRRLRRGDCSGALLYRCLGFDPAIGSPPTAVIGPGELALPIRQTNLLCVADRGGDGDLFPSDTELVRDIDKTSAVHSRVGGSRATIAKSEVFYFRVPLAQARTEEPQAVCGSYSAAIRTSGAAA